MPTIDSNTPRESLTIAGETFTAATPYAAGDVLTAGEASALNQTRLENLRNNFATKVKAAKETGTFDAEVFQATLDDLNAEYEFGVRRGGGGGRSTDPVMAEAMSIAREKVRAAIVKKGIKLADVSAAQITEHARKAIEANPSIMDLARSRVAAASEIADVEVGDITPSEPATDGASAAPSGKRSKASSDAATA